MVAIAKTVIGTKIDGEETLIMSAERAKNPLVIGLYFANAFVYACLSI